MRRQMTKISKWKKTGFCIVLLKNLWITLKPHLVRSGASHMFFKTKQQFSLCANLPKGALQQLFWGALLRVCLRPLNYNIHSLSVMLGFQPLSALKQKSRNRLDVKNDIGLIHTNTLTTISRLVAQMQALSFHWLASKCCFLLHKNIKTVNLTCEIIVFLILSVVIQASSELQVMSGARRLCNIFKYSSDLKKFGEQLDRCIGKKMKKLLRKWNYWHSKLQTSIVSELMGFVTMRNHSWRGLSSAQTVGCLQALICRWFVYCGQA